MCDSLGANDLEVKAMPRTYVFIDHGGPDKQRFVDVPKPLPGFGQLSVAVRAAGVNPADWKRRSGFNRVAEPKQLGFEVAGVVEEVGEGVDGFAVGDEVFGPTVGGGGFAEYALVSIDAVAKKPATVSFFDASTLYGGAAAAYEGVTQLDLAPGESLLITGVGGGIGVAAAQIALSRDLRVIGTASEAKREFVETLGVRFIAYGPGTLERLRAASPSGVAGIWDLVGGDALREVAPLAMDPSKIVSIADAATATELGGGPVVKNRNSALLEAIAVLAGNGTVRPYVTSVFPLHKAGEAIALVETGHATGKVVVEVT
jgi:NADPH:quinone reductase-like Zn-dependent oxidoreductase